MQRLDWRHLVVAVVVACLGCTADSSTAPPDLPDAGAQAAKFDNGLSGETHAKATVYCAGSNCFAAAFEFKDLEDAVLGPHTLFTAYFQNLQGTYPPGGPNTQLTFDWIHFHFFQSIKHPSTDFVDAFNMAVMPSPIGNVQAGAGLAFFHEGSANPGPGSSETFQSTLGGGIVGCDVNANNPPGFFTFRTCPSQDLDGWLKFEFVLRRFSAMGLTRPHVRFDDFFLSFGALSAQSICTIGGTKDGVTTHPTNCTELSYRKALGGL